MLEMAAALESVRTTPAAPREYGGNALDRRTACAGAGLVRTGPSPDVDDLDPALRKLLCAMRDLAFGDRCRREDLKPGCLMPVRGHN
jgi:hypothetical protein